MNLTQIKYFHTISACHSFSDAAERLFVSQPTLSSSMRELEREFGVALFHRHHRGVSLTAEGEIFFEATKGMLSEAERVENMMKDLGVARKTLRLGVPPMIGSLILPRIYRELAPAEPDIRLDITECGRRELCKMLDEGSVDMLFLPHNRPLESGMESREVGRLEIACCVSRDNPMAKLNSVSASALGGVPVVLFQNSFFQTDEIKRWFSESGLAPNVLLQTDQLSTMMSIISGNAAVGFAFRDLIASNPNLVAIPLDRPIVATVSLAWKRSSRMSGAMKRFRDFACGLEL